MDGTDSAVCWKLLWNRKNLSLEDGIGLRGKQRCNSTSHVLHVLPRCFSGMLCGSSNVQG